MGAETARPFAVVIIGGLILFIRQLSQPSPGSLSVGQITASPNTYAVSLTPVLKTSVYVTFDYPAGMTLQTSPPVNPPTLAEFKFTARDVESWVLAINVSTNPTGSLSGSSSYIIRKNNPTVYQASQMIVKGQSIPVMTDTTAGAFSKVAYITNGYELATVSLLGDDSSGLQPLQTTFSMVLNSWHWL